MRIAQLTWSLLCEDALECLINMGHEAQAVAQTGGNLIKRLNATLKSAKPDLLFSFNFNPHLAACSYKAGIPYAAWNIDNVCSSGFCSPQHAFPNTWIFTIDRPSLELFQKAGYANIRYLPIGSNLARFKPGHGSNPRAYDSDVSFVGCSMIRKGNEYPGLIAGLRRQLERQTDKRARLLCKTTIDALEKIVEAESRDFFQTSIQERIQQSSLRLGFDLAKTIYNDPPFFHIVLAKEVSSRKRLDLIRCVGKHFKVDLFGDADWQTLANNNIRYMGNSDYRTSTSNIYARSKINLNIEKVYNTSSLNLRFIDAMACGGFVLTETVDDLPHFFATGRELEVFSSIPELLEKTAHYLTHNQEREAIAEAGCQKVRAQFDLAARLSGILAAVFPRP